MNTFALTQNSFICVALLLSVVRSFVWRQIRAIDSCITFKHQIANAENCHARYDTEFVTLRNTSQNTRIITQKLLRLIAR